MKALSFSKSGVKTTEATLPKAVFEAKLSQELLAQAVERTLANKRHAGAKTLTRGEVRGGGKKPWRQKGTGRARFGSSRVNIWRHGGIAHGPNGEQNYHKDMPVKMIQASIRAALTAQAESVKVIEKLSVVEPKTKLVDALLEKIGAEGTVLCIADTIDEKFAFASRNLTGVKLIPARSVQAFDILTADCIIIEKAGLEVLDKWLGGKK